MTNPFIRLILSSWVLLLLLPSTHAANDEGTGTSADLEDMFDKMKADTLAFALKMEDLLLPVNRCSTATIQSCSEANYEGCNSELPSATCPGYDYAIPACGGGKEGGCGGLFDFTASRVSLAPGENRRIPYLEPTDREKDGVCSSLPVEEYMIEATELSKAYWDSYSVFPPRLYYGSDDGIFRIYPGYLQQCSRGASDYDPRNRPWYAAASSGPKDIILVLDTSGSMKNAGRMDIMKDAAKRVIGTLGVSDYFAVIEFNSSANHLGGSGDSGGTLQRATDENKSSMLARIDSLQADGGTNFAEGYRAAFKIIESSNLAEITSGCRQAILFLTDGEMGDSEPALFILLDAERAKYTSISKDPPVMFTYSFGAGAAGSVPKRIACDYRGIWSQINDGEDLGESMGAYYKYFAYGLGEANNDDFVAWVAPYQFADGGGLGTTVSAPVYDKSVSPPILAGVVGLDFTFVAMERALGKEGEASKNAVIEKIVERSVAVCPNLELTDCQLESLRQYGSGDDSNAGATCGVTTCTTIQPLKASLCNDTTYPGELWSNRLNEGRTYEERVCCSVGAEPRIATTLTYDEIKDLTCKEGSNIIVIVLVVAASFAILKFMRRSKGSTAAGTEIASVPIPDPKLPIGNYGYESKITSLPIPDYEYDVVVMPPPTAPPAF